MPFTLFSHGTTLGRTGAELGGMQAASRGWHFLPDEGFAAVRDTLLALQRATLGMQELMPDAETLASTREDERAAFVHRALMSDARAPRFLALMDEVEALALELRDDDGHVVPTRTLGVTELELAPRDFRALLESLDPGADSALSARPPFYLLVAGL